MFQAVSVLFEVYSFVYSNGGVLIAKLGSAEGGVPETIQATEYFVLLELRPHLVRSHSSAALLGATLSARPTPSNYGKFKIDVLFVPWRL
jgi:hypothetical protein